MRCCRTSRHGRGRSARRGNCLSLTALGRWADYPRSARFAIVSRNALTAFLRCLPERLDGVPSGGSMQLVVPPPSMLTVVAVVCVAALVGAALFVLTALPVLIEGFPALPNLAA